MIINSSHIRQVRPVADNIDDTKRIDQYIREAESLWVLPALGADVYKAIDVAPENYTPALEGCYYDDNTKHHEGLITAIAYLAYSRFIRSQSINVTAFGVVMKRGEFSQPIDPKSISMAAGDAEKTGIEYLRQTVEYLKYIETIESCKPLPVRRRFKAIG